MAHSASPLASVTSALLPSAVTAAPPSASAPGIVSTAGIDPELNGAVKILTVLPMGANSVLPSGDVASWLHPEKPVGMIVNAGVVYGESTTVIPLPVHTNARPLGAKAMAWV